MTTTQPDKRAKAQDQPFRFERGADGQSTVTCSIDGRERRIAFADFVQAERRHALALRRAAIDRTLASVVRTARHTARRLRRRAMVVVVRALRSARPQPMRAAA